VQTNSLKSCSDKELYLLLYRNIERYKKHKNNKDIKQQLRDIVNELETRGFDVESMVG
jgi:uncharacterized protein (UPF0335 family)